LKVHERIYVGGRWSAPRGGGAIDVIDPATESAIGRVPAATRRDAEDAADAARDAFPGWAATPPPERAAWISRLGVAIEERREEIAQLVTAEIGAPLELSRRVHAAAPAAVLASYPRIVAEHRFEERIGNSLVLREPVGVVACITPWNFPLHQIVVKVAPALAAGCTVVVKPSEVAPLSAYLFAQIAESCGLPAGVLNLVPGTGAEVGEALAASDGVDMVSFTGSTRAGKRVAELAARGVKRVALELGGKSPNVILDDADLERAVRTGVAACFLNSGQACNALSRMLVPRARLREATEIAVRSASGYTVGPPADPSTRLGPLASSAQRERVRELVRSGIDEGAELALGGPEPPAHLPRGWYFRPTVFTSVTSSQRIAREEIFGPVLSILPHDGDEDAIRIANDTIYGLAAAVWSRDPERAARVARRIRAGQVDLNGAKWNVLAPFGGFKQSGFGRELGRFGLEEFLETKSLQS
jgi:acyl-CoA reductase-like NAD-dependent aldehyde dehydrogenase